MENKTAGRTLASLIHALPGMGKTPRTSQSVPNNRETVKTYSVSALFTG